MFYNTVKIWCNFILDQTAKALLIDPEASKPNPKNHTPTIYLTILFFLLSYVPLWGNEQDSFQYTMTFNRANTWMALGTQPFVVASMMSNLWNKEMPPERTLTLGFILYTLQALTYNPMSYLQLLVTGWGLYNAIHHTDSTKISLTTSLILVNGSLRFIQSGFLGIVLSSCCIFALCYVSQMYLPILLTHTKSRQITSSKLNVTYNGNTPLIVYYTLVEWMPFQVPFLLLIPCVYWLCTVWPSVADTTGYSLVNKYAKDDLTLKGWRSRSGMGKHVDTQVRLLCKINACLLIAMATATTLLPTRVSCGTLLILVQSLSQLESASQLQKKLRPLFRLLRV